MPVSRLMTLPVTALIAMSAVPAYLGDLVEQAPPVEQDGVTDKEFHLALDGATATEVETLIPLLGAADYQTRERTTSRLIEIGAPAFAKLRETYRQADDLEVRLRIEQVVQTAYLDYHVYTRKGFLGVGLRPYVAIGTADPALPAGTSAVTLTEVYARSAAERGGLRENDVVIGINGRPFRGVGAELVDEFSKRIADHRPGERMTLTLYRGRLRREIEVAVGRCPGELARGGRVRPISEALQLAQNRFITWWSTYFRPAPPESVSPCE